MKTMTGNFTFYTDHQEQIIDGHLDEFILIYDGKVIGYYKNESDAFNAAKDYTLGTFMVKKCQHKGDDIIHFHTNRIRFA